MAFCFVLNLLVLGFNTWAYATYDNSVSLACIPVNAIMALFCLAVMVIRS